MVPQPTHQGTNRRVTDHNPSAHWDTNSRVGNTAEHISPFGPDLEEGPPLKEEEEAQHRSDSKLSYPQHTTPVGGRLSGFLKEWQKITTDKWILKVIQFGYSLELMEKPKSRLPRQTSRKQEDLNCLKHEVQELLQKNAIEEVPHRQRGTGVYSTYFLVQKQDLTMRPILDLRGLNRSIKTIHFKMTTLQGVIPLIRQGDYLATLDLKDAYLHIPMCQAHRKYLRFMIEGTHYQFKVLAFGVKSAPRVFTKCLAAVAAHLRRLGIHVYPYLDDWLIRAKTYDRCQKDVQKVIMTLHNLGFTVNAKKSSPIPQQEKIFLGACLNTRTAHAYPAQKRAENIVKQTVHYRRGQSLTVRTVMRLMGMLASCIPLIPQARLHMRPIQEWLTCNWSQATGSWEDLVVVSKNIQEEMSWWSMGNILKGRSFLCPTPSVTITTDASHLGWGAHMGILRVRGLWGTAESHRHINWLELKTIHLALKAFRKQVEGRSVLIQTDNTTAMFYLNKQGEQNHSSCHSLPRTYGNGQSKHRSR